MDALTITLIVLAAANAAGIITTAIAGIYWNAKIREAKDTQIQTIRESKDSEILSLQRQLEDAKEMNDVRFREVANVQKEGLKEYIDQIEPQLKQAKEQLQEADAKAVSLEASAAEGERVREELADAMEDVKLLEGLLQDAQQDRDAAERMSRRGRRFIQFVGEEAVGAAFMRRFGNATIITTEPVLPFGKEGESSSDAGDQQS